MLTQTLHGQYEWIMQRIAEKESPQGPIPDHQGTPVASEKTIAGSDWLPRVLCF